MAKSRPVVVLVEDHGDTSDMYAESLEFAGFRVHTAATADRGFELAAELHPGIVVTDFWLQGSGSGAELCHRLKHDSRTRRIPTLLVTASSQRKDVERALEQGCAVVRLKPYLPVALARDIRSLLAGKSIPQWPAEHN